MRAIYWSGRRGAGSLARLVAFIARDRHDGYTYVASVQWLGGPRADRPERSELRVQAAE
jgi:hypothetical protein